jgi:hypothetical protein
MGWHAVLARSALVGLCATGCIAPEPYPCTLDAQCGDAQTPGRCEPDGWCAHVDATCDSGWRYGPHAPSAVASTCTNETDTQDSDSNSGSDQGTVTEHPDVEICDGIDNDGDGLIDEWSPLNDACNGCSLHERDGRVYWLCPGSSWPAAQQSCMQWGANLTSIADAGENLFIALLVPTSAYWIGLNDLGQAGDFNWVDGSPLAYTNWPDGTAPEGSGTSCIGINPYGEWLALSCNNGRAFFCGADNPIE